MQDNSDHKCKKDEYYDEDLKRCSKNATKTQKFVLYTSFSLIMVAVIGAIAFALAIFIITPIQSFSETIPNGMLYVVLFLLGILMLLAYIQMIIERKKNKYQPNG